MGDNYELWLKRAKSNLALAETSARKDVFYEDLCFQAQQAAEKALKAFLIYQGAEPARTHNLVSLLQDAAKYIEIPSKLKDVVILNDYAVQTRYPGDYTPIDQREYENALEIAKYCVCWVEEKIPQKKTS